jgi:hypothetical protein
MAKDKYDFISELLNSNKISPSQKERVLMLSSQEIQNDKQNGVGLEARIKKLEDLFLIEKEKGNKPIIGSINSELEKYIDPSHLSSFLQAFNKNPILKTTCHEIDEEELASILKITGDTIYNYSNHYQSILNEYNILENGYFVNGNLKALIRGYLTGLNYYGKTIKGWSSNEIKINWNSEELIEWAKRNPGVPPNLDKILKKKLNNLGFRFNEINRLGINSFLNLVLYFKRLFHIREDNSLKSIIQEINLEKEFNDKIEFEINDTSLRPNIEFFTDVDKLKQVYNSIILLILEVVEVKKSKKPKIKLSLSEYEKSIVFSIHHQNTVFTKTAQNLVNRIGQKHINLINNQINGLCDLYIKGDFGNDEYAEINLWDGKERQIKKTEVIKGVEHKLVFRTK